MSKTTLRVKGAHEGITNAPARGGARLAKVGLQEEDGGEGLVEGGGRGCSGQLQKTCDDMFGMHFGRRKGLSGQGWIAA